MATMTMTQAPQYGTMPGQQPVYGGYPGQGGGYDQQGGGAMMAQPGQQPVYGASCPPQMAAPTTHGGGTTTVKTTKTTVTTGNTITIIYIQDESPENRNAFIRKVFMLLGIMLTFTFGCVAGAAIFADHKERNDEKGWETWRHDHRALLWGCAGGGLVGYLVCLCCVYCCRKCARTSPQSYILLTFFTIFFTAFILPFTLLFKSTSLWVAGLTTCGLAIGLIVYAMTTSTDFTGCGMYLFAGLLALILGGIVISCMGAAIGYENLHWSAGLNVLFVVLFSFFLVYDVQMIMGGEKENSYRTDEYVEAVVEIYLDIMYIFIYMLALFGDAR